MKMQIKLLIAAIAFTGFSACKDTDKNDGGETETTVEQRGADNENGAEGYEENTNATGGAVSNERSKLTGTANGDSEGSESTGFSGDGSDGRTAGTAVNKAKIRGSKGTTEKDRKSGTYSAADGTDAENSDGDYYTRNDTTRMPSGTPIK